MYSIKINKEIIAFGAIEIEKQKINYSRHTVKITNVDVNKILIFNEITFRKKGFKYVIG